MNFSRPRVQDDAGLAAEVTVRGYVEEGRTVLVVGNGQVAYGGSVEAKILRKCHRLVME